MGHSPHAWVDPRRGRPGHQPHPADDLRDLPDLPVPPRGRGAAGRDAAAAVRRPVHPRPGRGGEPQRARRRAAAGRPPTSGRRCSSRRSRSSASSSTATATPTSAVSTSTSSRPSSGTCPSSGCRSAVAVSGKQSCTIAGELADVMVAVEPEPELGEMFDAAGGAGKPRYGQLPISFDTRPARPPSPRAHTVPVVRAGLEGQRRAARAGGLRRGEPFVREEDVAEAHPLRGRRRRGHRGRARSTPTPASPTWRWCRSAATSSGPSSSGAEQHAAAGLARGLRRLTGRRAGNRLRATGTG